MALVMGKHFGGYQGHAVSFCINVGALIVEHDGIAVGCGVVVVKLVTDEVDCYESSVRLRHLHHSAVCRNCKGLQSDNHNCQKQCG